MDDTALTELAAVVLDSGVDGLIATNTTLSRAGLTDAHATETGGLSGAPLFDRSTRVLARLHLLTRGRLPIIGVGGIGSPQQAWDKIAAGATAVQIYSALIYQGLSLAPRIARELDRMAEDAGLVLVLPGPDALHQFLAAEIVAREGGFVNDPDDPGGATKYGVTIGTLRRLGIDLNGDGRIDARDAAVLAEAAERVEQAHPELVGGVGIYRGNGAHGPFVHIDTRGKRARWGHA